MPIADTSYHSFGSINSSPTGTVSNAPSQAHSFSQAATYAVGNSRNGVTEAQAIQTQATQIQAIQTQGTHVQNYLNGMQASNAGHLYNPAGGRGY